MNNLYNSVTFLQLDFYSADFFCCVIFVLFSSVHVHAFTCIVAMYYDLHHLGVYRIIFMCQKLTYLYNYSQHCVH